HRLSYCLYSSRDRRDLHSFPTRRSSDLRRNRRWYFANCAWDAVAFHAMLNEEIRIGSQCHHCAESISITLANGRATASPRETRRSEEHTSELQSRGHLVCRLLLEKKKAT